MGQGLILDNTNEYIIKAKNDIEDNNNLFLSVADSMSGLCEKLSRLEYVLKRKNIEQTTYPKGKEKQNED
jgi:hypothetical protein